MKSTLFALALTSATMLAGAGATRLGTAGSPSGAQLDSVSLIKPDRYLEIEGTRMHFTRSGQPASDRPTLVLVHGFGASHQTWHDIYLGLAAHYPTVLVDLKGFGFSDKPDDGRYRPEDQADFLAAFLTNLPDDRIVVVGHSYGGGVGVLAYERLRNAAKHAPVIVGLVLLDAAIVVQELPFFLRHLRNPVTSIIVENVTTTQWRMRYVLKRIFEVKSRVTPDRVRRYAYFLDLPGAERAARKTARQIDLARARKTTEVLSEVSVPVLLIWGDQDAVIPLKQGQALAKLLPRAELRVLPETGHVPHEERPEETLRLVEAFLGRFRW